MPATRTKPPKTKSIAKVVEARPAADEEQLRLHAFEIYQMRIQPRLAGDHPGDWPRTEFGLCGQVNLPQASEPSRR